MSRLDALVFFGVAMSMGEAAKPILFQGVKASCNVVLRGRRRTSWHSHTCLQTCRKSFCGTGAILLRRFQKMRCIFQKIIRHTPHSALYTPPSSAFHSLQRTGTVTRENVQDCSNILFHKSVLCDCIRVRGLHLAMFHGSFDVVLYITSSMCTVDVEYGHLGNPMRSFINGCVWTTNLRIF